MRAPDVLIVGAGLAGCSVTWHLAGQAKVVLLDRGAPGAQASSQNAGMVRRLGEDPHERQLALRTHAFLEEPGEDWRERPPSRRTGALLALREEPAHLHDAAAHLRSRGVPVQRCDRPEQASPLLAGVPLAWTWYLPDERVADAHSLISGYLAGARRRGAIVERQTVLGLLRDGDRVVGVRTEQGERHAGAVVLAAGAWSAALAATAGLHRPLVPLRRTLLQSHPHPAATREHPWLWLDDVGLYVRPEGGGWLVSACDEAVDRAPREESRGQPQEWARGLVVSKLRAHLPALADLRFSGGWTGLRTFYPDRRPVLGHDPEAPGLWWCAGLGGFGVTAGHAAGEAVAAWLVGGSVAFLSPGPVSPARQVPGRFLIRPEGDLLRGRLVASN